MAPRRRAVHNDVMRHFPNARHQTMPQFSTTLGEVPMLGKARLAGILGHRAPCPRSHLVGFVAAQGTSSGCHRCPYPAPTRYGSTKFAGRSCVVASLGREQIVHAPFVPTASVSALRAGKVFCRCSPIVESCRITARGTRTRVKRRTISLHRGRAPVHADVGRQCWIGKDA